MAQQLIKVFSHNDLDGFGAPLLLKAVQPTMLANVEISMTNCGAGRIDDEFAKWLTTSEASQTTDVYIMDMTPDSDYTFQQLNSNFANHWLVFDHHESEAELRNKYAANSIVATNPDIAPSATSLVWDWLHQQAHFADLSEQRQKNLAYLVELIRAYDTWDWQNDPDMSDQERQDADNFDQLFWFNPLQDSAAFVENVLSTDWQNYAAQNSLLIKTLNERRAKYLKSHLKDTLITQIDGHTFGVVYASDYKSEIAHELLKEHPDAEAALVISPVSVSLRSNGKLDVAKFAEKYFNGGGHADAAGGRLTVNPVKVGEQAVVDDLVETIKNHQESNQTADEGTLADDIDPELAEKMRNLFK
ncbi:dhha1 domain protein [Limosilactobacillus frumenti DSM 13145]|uniref:Dhha1 domain protein n=1 Tax=Limosilactobacillus frumenti DSM 13145 TaxID=1423746 RepID=A0A0R1PE59_9LACO|nr:DHHA1 domain-containing protein [Limosilactobacillus frumenti]KRL27962.1 dhha1 domain protein [Limosilactobacillus frumenti DSM 13145]MBA2913544.1 phosphoesterase [Limosilactobacillus frumenti]QFG73202.1 phosphoesterase [Limosilactobacillus frumenti]